MHFIKIFIFIALCLAIGILGCTKETEGGSSQTGANHYKFGSTEGGSQGACFFCGT